MTPIERLTAMADLFERKQNEVAAQEKAIKKDKEALLRMAREDLPEMMREVGLADLTTTGGVKIELAEGLQKTVAYFSL